MAKLPFEALIFDVGGIIVPHDNERLYRRLAEHCTAPDALDRIRVAARMPDYETGVQPIAALHARLADELGLDLDWDAFVPVWCHHLSLDRAVLEYVQDLAAANRVMLFSNTNGEHWEHLLALTDGALGRFETYLSHELGCAKPSVEAFRLVAARAGIAPARSLFFDDKPANVAAARRAGFEAEIFTDLAALQRYLASRVS